jgi:pimeloyl-ACP methyl ester carboxylesterase
MANPCETFGTGPVHVIVLNGWFGSAAAWGNLVPHLDGAGFTYAFMDYRGYGAARDMAGDYTLAEISADVLALADDLGWDQFALIGHSMGGMFIQRVALDAPERVTKLVALTPVPANGVPLDDDGHALFHGAITEIGNRAGIIDFTTGNRNKTGWVQGVADHSWANSTPEAFAAYLTLWTERDFSDEATGNPVPVLVLAGEHDPALTADVMNATFMVQYPAAELHIIGNAGHYPMDETPVHLATVIEAFLG